MRSLPKASSEQVRAFVSAGSKTSKIGSRLVVARIASEDICIKLSFSQVSTVVPLDAL